MNEDLRPLEWLVGTWEGTASGGPGEGAQTRRYELVLRGEFIMGTNRTEWSKTADHPDGEVHEDVSLISYDRAAKRFVMHVFYVERFVAGYGCEQQGADTFVFTADRVQNGPPGMRARETLARHGDELRPRFEVAMAGEDFVLYTSELLRKRP